MLSRMQTRNSTPGPDSIPFVLLQNLPLEIMECILIMINSSWSTGTIPSDWKHAFVVPIFKPGKNPQEVNSYRPIAMLNTFCKLMEKMVSHRLSRYMDILELFNKYQAGFRKNCGTNDQTYRLKIEAETAIKSGNCTVAIFLDFSMGL